MAVIEQQKSTAPARGWVQKQDQEGETYFCKIATGEVSQTLPTELSFQERLRYKKLDQQFGARAKQEMDSEEYVVEARERRAKLVQVQEAARMHCSNLDNLCESATELAVALDGLMEEQRSDDDGESIERQGAWDAWECMLMKDELEGTKAAVVGNVMEPVSAQLDLHGKFEEKVTAQIDALVDALYYRSKVNQLESGKGRKDVFKQDRNKLKLLEMEHEVDLAKHELQHQAAVLRHGNTVWPALCTVNNIHSQFELLQTHFEQLKDLKEMHESTQAIAKLESELMAVPSKAPPPEKPAVSDMKSWLHGVKKAQSLLNELDEEEDAFSEDEPEREREPTPAKRATNAKIVPKPKIAEDHTFVESQKTKHNTSLRLRQSTRLLDDIEEEDDAVLTRAHSLATGLGNWRASARIRSLSQVEGEAVLERTEQTPAKDTPKAKALKVKKLKVAKKASPK